MSYETFNSTIILAPDFLKKRFKPLLGDVSKVFDTVVLFSSVYILSGPEVNYLRTFWYVIKKQLFHILFPNIFGFVCINNYFPSSSINLFTFLNIYLSVTSLIFRWILKLLYFCYNSSILVHPFFTSLSFTSIIFFLILWMLSYFLDYLFLRLLLSFINSRNSSKISA